MQYIPLTAAAAAAAAPSRYTKAQFVKVQASTNLLGYDNRSACAH
jgi:hypothetical protein